MYFFLKAHRDCSSQPMLKKNAVQTTPNCFQIAGLLVWVSTKQMKNVCLSMPVPCKIHLFRTPSVRVAAAARTCPCQETTSDSI